jgi:hypothetical protein
VIDLQYVALGNSVASYADGFGRMGEHDYELAALHQFADEVQIVIELLGRKSPTISGIACAQCWRIGARLRAACQLTSDIEPHTGLAELLERAADMVGPEYKPLLKLSLKAILRLAKRAIKTVEEHRESTRPIAA